MEMEVIMPSAPVDFNFDSNCTSPYVSAPSSPQRFGTFFFSAPTSPTRASSFYSEFNNLCSNPPETNESLSAVPFNWEEKPGIPKTRESLVSSKIKDYDDNDFAFDFTGQLETSSLSADELFDGGKIKPLKPPPRLQFDQGKLTAADSLSPKSPRSPKKKIKEALSPRHKKKDFDPFAAALERTSRESIGSGTNTTIQEQRGRERNQNSSFRSRQKGTRSLSPFRVSDLLLDRHENNQEDAKNNSASSPFSSSFSWLWYKKWKLKDLLLFRSASEGRPTSKDQLKKYSILKKNEQEDVKNSSFRSTDSVGSSVSSSKRRGQVSAHELHYTTNRAVSEELKKKTFLPYKQGLLGCLGFNPGVPIHEIFKLGSMTRARG